MGLFGLGSGGRPSAEQAAKRLIVLKCVAGYALTSPPREMLKTWLQNWSADERDRFARDAESKRDEHWTPLRALGWWKELSPLEREFAETTLLTMTDEQQVNASWRVEAIQLIMWALGMVPDLPPYGTQADSELLKGVPTKDAAKFVRSARLRSRDELDRMRSLAELWHWRSRTRELIEQGQTLDAGPELKAAGFETFGDIVRFTANRSRDDGRLEVIDEDFGVNGKAYRDLSESEWTGVRSVTVERHFALNWLCGLAPGNRWDETPTDT